MFFYEAINIHITFYLYTYFTTISFAFAEKEHEKFTLFPHEGTLIIGRKEKNERKKTFQEACFVGFINHQIKIERYNPSLPVEFIEFISFN